MELEISHEHAGVISSEHIALTQSSQHLQEVGWYSHFASCKQTNCLVSRSVAGLCHTAFLIKEYYMGRWMLW